MDGEQPTHVRLRAGPVHEKGPLIPIGPDHFYTMGEAQMFLYFAIEKNDATNLRVGDVFYAGEYFQYHGDVSDQICRTAYVVTNKGPDKIIGREIRGSLHVETREVDSDFCGDPPGTRKIQKLRVWTPNAKQMVPDSKKLILRWNDERKTYENNHRFAVCVQHKPREIISSKKIE